MATSSATRWVLASRWSGPVGWSPCQPCSHCSRQRRSQAGAVSGMSFCQKLGPPTPLGNRLRLSGRSARCGSMTGAIRPKYAMRSRFVIGGSSGVAGCGGKSTLSRFVSLSSRPPTRPDALAPEPRPGRRARRRRRRRAAVAVVGPAVGAAFAGAGAVARALAGSSPPGSRIDGTSTDERILRGLPLPGAFADAAPATLRPPAPRPGARGRPSAGRALRGCP